MNIFELPVHPSAELLPISSDDDLKEMAETIKSRGLLHPVVIAEVDEVVVLIDGRNRRAACKIAGVTPEYETYEGSSEDVEYYIYLNNLRRNASKSQIAMAYAVQFPETTKYKRGGSNSSLGEDSVRPSDKMLSYARKVLKFLPDIEVDVRAGTMSLNKAYDLAVQEEKDLDERKHEADRRAVRMGIMQNDNPDLYELVVEERMSFEEAEELVNSRNSEHITRIELDAKSVDNFFGALHILGSVEGLNDILDNTREGLKEDYITLLPRDGKLYDLFFDDINNKIRLIKEFHNETK